MATSQGNAKKIFYGDTSTANAVIALNLKATIYNAFTEFGWATAAPENSLVVADNIADAADAGLLVAIKLKVQHSANRFRYPVVYIPTPFVEEAFRTIKTQTYAGKNIVKVYSPRREVIKLG